MKSDVSYWSSCWGQNEHWLEKSTPQLRYILEHWNDNAVDISGSSRPFLLFLSKLSVGEIWKLIIQLIDTCSWWVNCLISDRSSLVWNKNSAPHSRVLIYTAWAEQATVFICLLWVWCQRHLKDEQQTPDTWGGTWGGSLVTGGGKRGNMDVTTREMTAGLRSTLWVKMSGSYEIVSQLTCYHRPEHGFSVMKESQAESDWS